MAKTTEKRKRIRSITAVTWLLVLALFGIWLGGAACLTIVTAQELYDKLYEASYDYTNRISDYGIGDYYDPQYSSFGYQYERPDHVEYRMFDSLRISSYSLSSIGSYGNMIERSKLLRDTRYEFDTAVLFYDGEGKLLHMNSDFLYFDYYSQEAWQNGETLTAGENYGWIDLSVGKDEEWPNDPYLRLRTIYAGTQSLFDIEALRVTGVFDGTQLKPVSMYFVDDTRVYQALEQTDEFTMSDGGYEYTMSALDATGLLEWQTQFDNTATYTGGDDLVTVYIEHPQMYMYVYKGEKLYYDGTEYESLASLTKSLDFPSWANIAVYSGDLQAMGKYSLDELLVFGGRSYANWADFDYGSGLDAPPREYYMLTATRCSPLRCAISALRNIYIISFALVLILFLVIRGCIKKRLVRPVEEITLAMDEDWKRLYPSEYESKPWREGQALVSHYAQEVDLRRINKNELARLTTALDYAKAAEQNRRRMTSNIAHELKTPLAIIHGYAEGLREHIADEKRDRYLDVILSEAERMDAMVLEMLDLSRLEAGKVKLARDDFSLTSLSRDIFGKLEPAAQAKELHIEYDFPAECIITADEARITQVIENFATNAVKYTPCGGSIRVRITPSRASTGVTFAMENDSRPFTREELDRVWDTFYRAPLGEQTRAGGTGLGLAIAKSIIELHGGRCGVINTQTGVQFSFTL